MFASINHPGLQTTRSNQTRLRLRTIGWSRLDLTRRDQTHSDQNETGQNRIRLDIACFIQTPRTTTDPMRLIYHTLLSSMNRNLMEIGLDKLIFRIEPGRDPRKPHLAPLIILPINFSFRLNFWPRCSRR